MLGRLGLELHPEKTRVVRAEDGFDFLGIHFQLCPVHGKNAKMQNYCALWPSDRSIKRIKERITDNLHIAAGETSEDMRFTMESVRCIGCCSLGPVVKINENT